MFFVIGVVLFALGCLFVHIDNESNGWKIGVLGYAGAIGLIVGIASAIGSLATFAWRVLP